MKANQAFKANDEAVSPVIGVILMVAITVVLAAVVFVLVSNLSKNSNSSSPNLSLQVDGTNQRINVISAASGADWSRLNIVATACTGTGTIINIGGNAVPHQNVAATSAAHAAISSAACSGTNTPVQIATTSAVINAGDFLSFCATTLAATNVNIQIVDTVANSQIGQFTLPSVSLCA